MDKIIGNEKYEIYRLSIELDKLITQYYKRELKKNKNICNNRRNYK